MKVNCKNEPGTYFTAFYGIEDNTLYTALEADKSITPITPVRKNFNGTYSFICVPKGQDFVDAVLNDIFVDSEDSSKKFSVVLKNKEVGVCSDGRMIFAFSHSQTALHYATKQIYENLDNYKTPTIVSYQEELENCSTFVCM